MPRAETWAIGTLLAPLQRPPLPHPEGSRSHIGALLLGYYTEAGRLHYAGRAGTGISAKELKRLADVLAAASM
jgi:ATP dependent DNA ligase-like protein